jgi:protein ImuB
VETIAGAPLLLSAANVEDKAALLREEPFALTHPVAGGMRIASLNEPAARVHIEEGQLLADARALYPEVILASADEEADKKALVHLAAWLGRYTPWTAPSVRSSGTHNGPDGVFLDITGCAHLFRGGEAGLLEDMMERLSDFGLEARAGLADSPGAAWAVAHYGNLDRHMGTQSFHVVPSGAEAQAIAHLPVAALRLEVEIVRGLDAMGLKKIHQLIPLSRAPLTARFGTDVAHRLDQALGVDEEPICPGSPLVPYRVRKVLAEPISTLEAVGEGVARLAEDLVIQFLKDRKGARRLTLTLYRVDGQMMRLQVGTATVSADPVHITRLFTEKLDRLVQSFDAGFGIDVMMLAAPLVEDKTPAQIGFQGVEVAPKTKSIKKTGYPKISSNVSGRRPSQFSGELSALLDRLGNRLGSEEVYQMKPQASHIPERAVSHQPVMAVDAGEDADWKPSTSEVALRPLTMLAHAEPIEVLAEVPDGPPRRFRWRRTDYQIVKTLGPERIAPEWWQTADLLGSNSRTRDYFQAEDCEGRRFWLYRNGLYGRETVYPKWYVHGVFG